eukprot:scaffold6237_cov336-Prasinococcus_capsulatus_cf.AAC.7
MVPREQALERRVEIRVRRAEDVLRLPQFAMLRCTSPTIHERLDTLGLPAPLPQTLSPSHRTLAMEDRELTGRQPRAGLPKELLAVHARRGAREARPVGPATAPGTTSLPPSCNSSASRPPSAQRAPARQVALAREMTFCSWLTEEPKMAAQALQRRALACHLCGRSCRWRERCGCCCRRAAGRGGRGCCRSGRCRCMAMVLQRLVLPSAAMPWLACVPRLQLQQHAPHSNPWTLRDTRERPRCTRGAAAERRLSRAGLPRRPAATAADASPSPPARCARPPASPAPAADCAQAHVADNTPRGALSLSNGCPTCNGLSDVQGKRARLAHLLVKCMPRAALSLSDGELEGGDAPLARLGLRTALLQLLPQPCVLRMQPSNLRGRIASRPSGSSLGSG